MRNTFLKMGVAALIFGIFVAFDAIAYSQTDLWDLSDVPKMLAFGTFYTAAAYIPGFFIQYFSVIMFQFWSGVAIYKRFTNAGVYYFSRCANRKKWIASEFGKLYLLSFFYVLVMLMAALGFSAVLKNIVFSKAGLYLCMYYLVIHSLWIFSLSLLINSLSVKFGSGVGFGIVSAVQLLFLSMYATFENVFNFSIRDNIEQRTLYLKLNPISHLVLKWHSSSNKSIDKLINTYDLDFELTQSVVLMLVIAGVCIALSFLIINRSELISESTEG